MHHQHDEVTTDGLKVDGGVGTVQVEPHLDHVQPVHGLVRHVNARMPVWGKGQRSGECIQSAQLGKCRLILV